MTHTRRTAIRAKTFKRFLYANLKDSLLDIAEHGADCGFPSLTYTSDCVRLFDKYGDEIWELAVNEAESLGENVATMIGQFRRTEMCDTLDTFKNLMVWFAAEHYAREYAEQKGR